MPASTLRCTACSFRHAPVELAPGETARCVRCGTALAQGSRFGADAALAWATAGLIIAVPAIDQPFVIVSKLTNERVGVLFSGVGALWSEGMRLLSAWVLVCGGLAPLLQLGLLVAIALPLRLGWRTRPSRRAVTFIHAVEHWAMPEVQVLAVLVALVKLHTLVGVRIGPGFWYYCALSFLTLLAWRSFDLEIAASRRPPGEAST